MMDPTRKKSPHLYHLFSCSHLTRLLDTLQDALLGAAVQKHGTEQWALIAELFPNKTESHCLRRYQSVLMPPFRKGPWTDEEDEKISDLVNKYGAKKWSFVASNLPGRKAKQCKKEVSPSDRIVTASTCLSVSRSLMTQCLFHSSGRERWHNHLQPDISKAEWTEQEDRIVLEFHQSNGNKWSELAKKLPGRYA